MTDSLKLTIDGREVLAPADATLLEAAQAAGIDIPTICYDPRCTSNGLCRMCVVEARGARTLVAACVTRAAEGMTIATHNERVLRSRRTTLEMLAATVDLSEAPDIQAQMAEAGADAARFADGATRQPEIIRDNPMYVRDYAKCVMCWRCVQVCAEDAQYTFALTVAGRGFDTHIGTFLNKPMPETTCVFCGQCVGVCPTNALKPVKAWELEQAEATA
ncbi:MAG: (2Fe-2S)-binding protein [Thermoflexales bacterium]|nr:(2Fe-2S)-binding protein [Thermoflexales bacterium]